MRRGGVDIAWTARGGAVRRTVGTAGLLAALLGSLGAAAAQTAPAGRTTYDRWCAGCHGDDGAGDGPAAGTMLPRPRDFTTGLYQIRTTPSGALPTDGDILRMIDEGMPGTAMPGWKDHLSEAERNELVEVLKMFSPAFERDPAEPVEIGSAPGVSDEGLAEGRRLYERIECWKCHGQAGRGDGSSAPTLEDDQDMPVRATDLTRNWLFNGGGSTEEIFTRLMTGLNGTPMPSFADLIDAEVVTKEELWRMAQYVRSLSPDEPPRTREVIRATLVDALPAAVDAPAWESAERAYVPLVGQVIEAPRWFAPTVDGVWVQALHDGEELAVLLTWHDPSRSPDPDWAEWRARVLSAMATDGGEAAAEPTDALAVQFPTSIPDGMERPYFLMGSEQEPVYLWHWESGVAGAREAIARGLAMIEPLAGEDALVSRAVYEHGRWQLLVRRPLEAGDVENRLRFEPGRAIPIALFAWDGSNGESGTQGAISTWYYLYLDQPTASAIYAVPFVAMLLTAALGIFVVVRAQRRAGAAVRGRGGALDREAD